MVVARSEAGEAGIRVLVVDDSAGMREMLLEAFRAVGWEAEGAEDGLQALTRLQHRPFDVVLTDLQMPRLDGLGLLRAIRRMEHPVPVVVHTALLEDRVATQLLMTGAFRVLSKGIPLENLQQSVEEAGKAFTHPPARCA